MKRVEIKANPYVVGKFSMKLTGDEDWRTIDSSLLAIEDTEAKASSM